MIIVDSNMSSFELEQFTYTQEAGVANKYDEKGTQLIQIRAMQLSKKVPIMCGWMGFLYGGLSVSPTVLHSHSSRVVVTSGF